MLPFVLAPAADRVSESLGESCDTVIPPTRGVRDAVAGRDVTAPPAEPIENRPNRVKRHETGLSRLRMTSQRVSCSQQRPGSRVPAVTPFLPHGASRRNGQFAVDGATVSDGSFDGGVELRLARQITKRITARRSQSSRSLCARSQSDLPICPRLSLASAGLPGPSGVFTHLVAAQGGAVGSGQFGKRSRAIVKSSDSSFVARRG